MSSKFLGPALRSLGLIVVWVFTLGALFYLQIQYSEKELLPCLVAYAAIATAAVISFAFFGLKIRGNIACLGSGASLVVYLLVRAIASPDHYAARPDLYLLLAATIIYLLAVSFFADPRLRILFSSALLVFAVVHVVVGVVQVGLGRNYSMLLRSLGDVQHSDRGAGLFVNPDHLAGFLELAGIFSLALTCWSRWPSWVRVVVAYLTGICYLGLLLTGSRGGYVSAAASLIAFALISAFVLRAAGTPEFVRFGGPALLLLIAAGTAAWLFIVNTPALSSRASNTFNVDQGRLDLWQAAIEQWKLQPVVGTGSGTYQFYGRQLRAPTMQQEPGDAHSDYLQLLCEYGVVGAILFAAFLMAHLREAWKTLMEFGPKRIRSGALLRSNRVALSIGGLCAIAAYSVHSAVDFNLHIPANALVVAFIFGVLANSGRESEAERSPLRSTDYLPRVCGIAVSLFVLLHAARLIPGEYFVEEARVALRDEDPASANSFAQKSLGYDRTNPRAFFYLGRALVALAHRDAPVKNESQLYAEALSAFEQARLLAPLDGTYPLELAHLFDRLSRFPEAEWMFYLARQRDPRSVSLNERYAYHLDLWQNAGPEETR